MSFVPRSEIFDDVYFSARSGLEETRHVFIAGNDLYHKLPALGQSIFTVAETGFGTGLNFLETWRLFEEAAPERAGLRFCSFELYPLNPDTVRLALAPWKAEFGGRLERLAESWPEATPGWHVLGFGPRISLRLYHGEALDGLREMEPSRTVDAWFLDGFTPAKNPKMWRPEIYAEMARLSGEGTSFATFTAAGRVRRGLAAAGFDVERQQGYAGKRHMSRGVFRIRTPSG